ncbi:MAG: BrnA antitoxin family protein [Clostridiales Family XIII bacterium]|jgi:hypothetical protein|nr:BrnA antitoxin family protein [Clostridiales Family XIII bacterium]
MATRYKENGATIVRYTREEIEDLPDRTEWDRVRAIKDEDILRDDGSPDIVELLHTGQATLIKRRGRPVKKEKKVAVSLRLDPATLQRLRASGKGWQTRLAEQISVWSMSLK